MERLIFEHSEDWIDKLLIRQELPPDERKEVVEHVASCATCWHMLSEYHALREQVRLHLYQYKPFDLSSSGLPPRLLELWRWEDSILQEEERISRPEKEWHDFVYEVVPRFKR